MKWCHGPSPGGLFQSWTTPLTKNLALGSSLQRLFWSFWLLLCKIYGNKLKQLGLHRTAMVWTVSQAFRVLWPFGHDLASNSVSLFPHNSCILWMRGLHFYVYSIVCFALLDSVFSTRSDFQSQLWMPGCFVSHFIWWYFKYAFAISIHYLRWQVLPTLTTLLQKTSMDMLNLGSSCCGFAPLRHALFSAASWSRCRSLPPPNQWRSENFWWPHSRTWFPICFFQTFLV